MTRARRCAGLISQGREAQWRPCRLEAAPIKVVADWTESYRRFWEESFDRLGDYLEQFQSRSPAGKAATSSKSKPGSRKSSPRTPSRRTPSPRKSRSRS